MNFSLHALVLWYGVFACGVTTAKSYAQSIYLQHWHSEGLPYYYLAIALFSTFTAPSVSRLLTRFHAAKILKAILLGFCVFFAGLSGFEPFIGPRLYAFVLQALCELTTSVVAILFWIILHHRVGSREKNYWVGRVTLIAMLGTALGGALLGFGASYVGDSSGASWLWVGAGFALPLLTIDVLLQPERVVPSAKSQMNWRALPKMPAWRYLLLLSLLVLLLSISTLWIDFRFRAMLDQHFTNSISEELGLVNMLAGLLMSIVYGAMLVKGRSRISLIKIGAALPLVMIFISLLSQLYPKQTTFLFALKVIDLLGAYGLYTLLFQSMYQPIREEYQSAARTLVEGWVKKAGTSVVALVLVVVGLKGHEQGIAWVSLLTLVITIGVMWKVRSRMLETWSLKLGRLRSRSLVWQRQGLGPSLEYRLHRWLLLPDFEKHSIAFDLLNQHHKIQLSEWSNLFEMGPLAHQVKIRKAFWNALIVDDEHRGLSASLDLPARQRLGRQLRSDLIHSGVLKGEIDNAIELDDLNPSRINGMENEPKAQEDFLQWTLRIYLYFYPELAAQWLARKRLRDVWRARLVGDLARTKPQLALKIYHARGPLSDPSQYHQRNSMVWIPVALMLGREEGTHAFLEVYQDPSTRRELFSYPYRGLSPQIIRSLCCELAKAQWRDATLDFLVRALHDDWIELRPVIDNPKLSVEIRARSVRLLARLTDRNVGPLLMASSRHAHPYLQTQVSETLVKWHEATLHRSGLGLEVKTLRSATLDKLQKLQRILDAIEALDDHHTTFKIPSNTRALLRGYLNHRGAQHLKIACQLFGLASNLDRWMNIYRYIVDKGTLRERVPQNALSTIELAIRDRKFRKKVMEILESKGLEGDFESAMRGLDFLQECNVYKAFQNQMEDGPNTSAQSEEIMNSNLELKREESFVENNILARLNFLSNVDLFQGLDLDALELIAGLARWHHLPAYSTLYEMNEPGDALYIVVEGEVEAYKDDVLTMTFGVGESLGQVSFLDRGPRPVTIRSKDEAVTLLRLPRREFFMMISERHDIMQGFFRVIAQRLRVLIRTSHDSP